MSDHRHIEERLPPNSRIAEKAVLGCVLRDKSVLNDLTLILRSDDFYLGAHQKIWSAFIALDRDGSPIDMASLADRLKADAIVEEIGGYSYILELWEDAPTTSAAEYHANIVKHMAIRREIIHAAKAMVKNAFTPGEDASGVIEDAERRLFDISQRRYSANNIIDMPKAVDAALEILDRRSGRHPGGEIEECIETGWIDLDRLLVGFQKSELVVVAARPGMCKTLFALRVICHAANEGRAVFFASLEQRNTELVHRMLARDAQVDSHHIRRGDLNDDESKRILDTADELRTKRIFFDDCGTQSAARIVSNARRLHAKHGLDLVVVDYLQIMEPEDHRDMETRQVGKNAWRMAQLAKELNVPVLLLCQLNRDLEKRADARPKLADLRGSGNIEEHAYTVLLLHKPEPVSELRENDILEVIVAKQKNGQKADVPLLHRKRYMDIVNYQPESDFRSHERKARNGYSTTN